VGLCGQEAIACPHPLTDKRQRGGDREGGGYERGRSSARSVTAAVPGWSRSPAIMPGAVDPGSLSALSFWSLLCSCGAHCPVCRARGRSASVEALLSLRSFLMLLWCWVSRACLGLCSSRGLSPLLNLALGVLPKNTMCYRVRLLWHVCPPLVWVAWLYIHHISVSWSGSLTS
jgi:hypothetical protein